MCHVCYRWTLLTTFEVLHELVVTGSLIQYVEYTRLVSVL